MMPDTVHFPTMAERVPMLAEEPRDDEGRPLIDSNSGV